uniref:Uncharacterized protein n=1 Tax=Knipowitschia caucasica TaxID=637954 RepID=A0AAV2K943_KNICA
MLYNNLRPQLSVLLRLGPRTERSVRWSDHIRWAPTAKELSTPKERGAWQPPEQQGLPHSMEVVHDRASLERRAGYRTEIRGRLHRTQTCSWAEVPGCRYHVR